MSKHMNRSMQSQRGYSLAEVLVASAIFTIIFIAALMIYDRSNQVFKQSVEATDLQQSTRVAFDQLVADVRMTGFDYDRDGRPFGMLGIQPWQPNTSYVLGNVVQPSPPNGHAYTVIDSGTSGASAPTWPENSGDEVDDNTVRWKERGILQYQQPDEQLEYMGSTAITLRGNLDFELDAANDNGREKNLESEYFPVVTTGNDEIVTYALKSADASKNDGEIVFYADVAIPREVHPAEGKAEKQIKITGVDLSNANPPYTLYRYTIKADGTPDAGTPLADNIRSLNFRYFSDTAGTTEAAPNLGAGQYDAATGVETAERQVRRQIRAIHVDLVGMNPQPDMAYTHPTDTVAPHHRQYALDAMIIPRNLGRRGMRELSVTDPGEPVIRIACAGSCDVVYVTWNPSTKGDVLTYNILYDNDSPNGPYTYLEDAGNNVEGYASKFILPGGTWYFKVQAINQFGYATSTDFEQITVLNTTTPEAPASLAASGGALPVQPSSIQITWPEVTANAASAKMLTCSDGSQKEQATMPGNERRYYRLYRGTTESFDPLNPSESVKLLDEYSSTQPSLSGTDLVFTDTTAANCKPYYYRIMVADYCARDAGWNNPANASTAESAFFPAVGNTAIMGIAESNVAPAKPAALTITDTDCTGANCDVTLSWSAVTKDVNGADLYIDSYEVVAEVENPAGSGNYDFPVSYPTTNGATTVVIPSQNQVTTKHKYYVRAQQCGIDSEDSDPAYFPCPFLETITISSIAFSGSGTAGDPWISSSTIGVSASVPMTQFEFWVEQGGSMVGSVQTAGAGISASFGVPAIVEDEIAVVYVRSTNAAGCTKLDVRYILDEPPPPCPAISLTTAFGGGGDEFVRYNLANTVAGNMQLTLKRVEFAWDRALTITTGPVNNPSYTVFDGITTDGFGVTPVAGFPTQAGEFFTHRFTVPAANPKLTANDATYLIQIVFDPPANNNLAVNPVTRVCVEFQSPTGDTFACGVNEPGTVPTSCTIP
jgi:prepilin-type N-terminal cleavage/methylation domain-containing protein